jgi:hypothetical protein
VSESIDYTGYSDDELHAQDETLETRYWDLQDQLEEVRLTRAAIRNVIQSRGDKKILTIQTY